MAGKWEIVVKQTRTAIDFSEILRYTADELYPKAEKIILVTDNLNIHASSSLYKAFSAKEANCLTKRFEWPHVKTWKLVGYGKNRNMGYEPPGTCKTISRSRKF
ncbi:MAG: hypothetical protein ACLR1V_14230 [Coprococcus sp.]